MCEQIKFNFCDEIEVGKKKKINLTIEDRIFYKKGLNKILPNKKCLDTDCRQYNRWHIEDCFSPNCFLIHETTGRVSAELRNEMVVF